MFVEAMLIVSLNVQEIRHDPNQQPHLHQTVHGEFPTISQGGGYTLSTLGASSVAFSGWIVMLPKSLTP